MCGRYYLKSPPAKVGAHFGVDVRDNFPPRYNISPTQPIATVRQSERRTAEYALMRWGFIPSWAKDEFLQKLTQRPMINARSETAGEKASFKNAYRRRRCLIPADGFYEWKADVKGAKQPHAISSGGGDVIAFAGLWETAMDPDGGEIDTVAILTTSAGTDLKSIHAREPVVIAPENYDLWLEADERDIKSITPLLKSAAPNSWSIHAVSKAVNAPVNDGPELIEPLAA
ncbi:SOS response-associated peptidase [Hyphococcus flavus]|uniref:Abasic site processing protein n=1 Tax=Hyphococcus flavus TaxID=1866326 RepID=A0AAF0CHC7_9PROT|nr:SOS response-associated peptidase [Hyphococcus flavus]WDI31752.1 SOS response-associated peptidase [Hyphococcus flavus]